MADYGAWLRYVFDHDVRWRAWYWDTSSDHGEPMLDDRELLEVLTLTFARAGQDLAGYSDAQVNQGLWYLASNSCSDYLAVVIDAEVPVARKIGLYNGVYEMYAGCFARRCTESISHRNQRGSPLNGICYMFWDVSVMSYLVGRAEEPQLAPALLSTLERTLALEHRACREGALHGLGEVHGQYPDAARRIVDRFLATTQVDAELRAYALQAREGCVL